nr:RNA-directed DNA polymerase, eukaryota, reverse transcriptase zinc-binding domain protein [Tanacetum cinerariifolium]
QPWASVLGCDLPIMKIPLPRRRWGNESDPKKEEDDGGRGIFIMGRSHPSTDAHGWTWTFRKNKDNITSKAIGNPFQKDLGKISSSFYVSNFPKSTNAKEL